MIRLGMIGCGKIAQIRHIPEALANPNVEIVGYYDYSLARAQEMARKFGGSAYEKYEDILENPQINAVCVLTPNNTHADISIAALRAGKDVLCEKPMATTLEDCIKMVEVSKETGKNLMIGLNQRFNRAHVVAKDLIKKGKIGQIITLKTTFGHSGADNWSIDGSTSWFFNKEKALFGVMGDLGIHKTDLIHFITDQKIVKVLAHTGTLHKKNTQGQPIPIEDNAVAIYTLGNGVIATMTASWTFYGKEDNSTIIYGTEGIMRIYDDPEYSIIIEGKNGEEVHYSLEAIQTNDNQTESGVMEEFANSILEGREPSISGADTLPAMAAVFAAMESSKTGKLIEI